MTWWLWLLFLSLTAADQPGIPEGGGYLNVVMNRPDRPEQKPSGYG